MNRAFIFAAFFLSCVSQLSAQGEFDSQNNPELHIALHCDFDTGTVTSSIPKEQIKNLSCILLARFGLTLAKNFVPQASAQAIRVNARCCSYAAYLAAYQKKHFHHQP
jgi:hypothetical protein